MEDLEIINLYWDRNEEAIRATDSKYGSWCRAIANRILAIREETEECVADTYFTVWNHIPPERPNVFRAWIGKITRNLALSRYRENTAKKRGGGETALCLGELMECVSGGYTPEEVLENGSITEVINRFLELLPKEQRNVFLRRYWYMTSVEEIADTYGMSKSKVTSMLYRQRKQLRMMLAQEGIDL